MPTWILPPDFNIPADGPIQLGNVIESPEKPAAVLATLNSPDSGVTLPKTTILVERDHKHSRSHGHSNGAYVSIEAFALASASLKANESSHASTSYGIVDHEIHTFGGPLTYATAEAIAAVPAVQKFMSNRLIGKRPVYVIAGIRVVRKLLSVKVETGQDHSIKLSASGPTIQTPVPLQLGAGASHAQDRELADSYKTAPGIVFAYQVYAVRHRRAGVEMGLFSSKSAFMCGSGTEQDEEDEGSLIVVEGTEEEIVFDIQEDSDWKVTTIGDDVFISF